MKNTIASYIYDATITSSTEATGYEFDEALIDTRLSKVGRTTSELSQWVKFEFSQERIFETVCIFGSNITESATVLLQAHATDSFSSPTVNLSMTYTKDVKRSLDSGTDIGVWTYQFTDATLYDELTTDTGVEIVTDTGEALIAVINGYKFWRISINDIANTDGYIEIGFIFIDDSVDFPGMSVNQVFALNTTSEPQFSVSGQVYGVSRIQYNGASFTHPGFTEAKKTELEKFFHEVDIVTPYLMFVWEDNLDVQRPLYVVNTSMPEWRRVETSSGVQWALNLSIREVF